jgi:hypothetical protein
MPGEKLIRPGSSVAACRPGDKRLPIQVCKRDFGVVGPGMALPYHHPKLDLAQRQNT